MPRNFQLTRRLLPVAAAGVLGFAAGARAAAEIWIGTAEVEFDATSTLHDFSGTVPVKPFPATVLEEGDFATLGGTTAVAVAQMDTRHAKRDANLRKMFEAERHPLIHGSVAPIRIDSTAPPPTIPVQITIRERTLTLPATLTNWRRENGRYRFELAISLSLKAFELKPPVILGFIRVGDIVVVRARVQLDRPADLEKP